MTTVQTGTPTKTETPSIGELIGIAVVLAAVSVSPLMFVVSTAGYSSMNWLGWHALLPALAAFLVVWGIAAMMGWRRLAAGQATALWVGILATVGLEIVRLIGFREFGAMPGSMPELMGVLLTNQFMSGPDWWSNLLGWGDHFWNGISFATIYIVLLGRRAWWVGSLYALLVGTVFMVSPVMSVTGSGLFGQQFAPIAFPVTVYLAHLAFGTIIGYFVSKSPVAKPTLLTYLVDLLTPRPPSGQPEAR
ncbi:MAG TPA: hypothetical protein VFA48_12200 [Gammaproteobacteria bacterium]|nr:hypothetical protein [Gammaproteobacteria bacterium]